MSDPRDKDERQADELARLPALLKEWQGVVAVLGGAVTALLSVLLRGQTPAAVQVIGYGSAVLMLGAGAYVFVRVRRRRQARRLGERRRETAGAHATAFRGLFPYQEGDELPGEHRQLEARRLVTQFSEPTFSFGVVCGDSGCGKTSLLRSAIQSRLKAVGEERGFGVLYLSSPRELADDGAREDVGRRLRGELERLGRLAAGAAEGRPLILIIDQFEEFFIEYGRPELRLEVGRFIDGLIKSSPPVRILCAVRRDHLADMKDLAPPRPDAGGSFFEPISLRGLFTLKNFTVEQAARVIKECAGRDGLDVDDEFARTLANDLGEGDSVRPPELQIVCTALGGNPTLAEYRLAGGARGILSHYIGDAVGVSGDPHTGRRVLRALCDFPAHAKRNPQAVAEIAEAAGVEGAQASALIRAALRQFERARIVVSERRGDDEPVYALVHDYLVDAVAKATSDVSTRDEEANQLLEYYVAEYRTDPRAHVPFRRLRFIRKYADRKKLADPTARRLVRASITRLAASTAALAALVAVATTLLAALTATRGVWHQEVVGNHWDANESGQMAFKLHPNGRLLLTGTFDLVDGFGRKLKLWDVKTARQVHHTLTYESIMVDFPDYLLGISRGDAGVAAFHIPTGRTFRTAIAAEQALFPGSSRPRPVYTSESGDVVSFLEYDEVFDARSGGRPLSFRSYSVADNRLLAEFDETCNISDQAVFYFTDGGGYFITLCNEGFGTAPTVFNMRTKEKRVLVRNGYIALGQFDIDERNSRIATIETSRDRRDYLVLWDMRTGGLLEQVELAVHAGEENLVRWVSFAPDGAFLYVVSGRTSHTSADSFLVLFKVAGLRRDARVPLRGARALHVRNLGGGGLDENRLMLMWPKEGGGTYLWDLAEDEPRLLADFTLPGNEEADLDVSLSAVGVRAIKTVKEEGRAELWDFTDGKHLRTLDIPGRFKEVGFTIGGNAVSVNVEGGSVSLFRADTGEKITDDLRDVGGTQRAIFYDEECRRAHVWTNEGRVLRYTYGWHVFGRESWFWPAEKCQMQ